MAAEAIPSGTSGTSGTSGSSLFEIGAIRQPKGAFKNELPAWSSAPVAPFDGLYAEVFEQPGVILSTSHLGKSRGHSFGRNVEWCDGVLPKHASISRQHAAVVHTKQGPVAVDLFSSHGTFLNSTRLLPSRPYPIYEGDVLRFGAAAGQYKLKGTGRAKRREGEKVEPIGAELPPSTSSKGKEAAGAAAAAAGGDQMDESASGSAKDRDAKHADAASAGDKRRRGGGAGAADSDATTTRKDQKTDHGRVPAGLADPKTGRIRCSHLLVKHSGSRRPTSWREQVITIDKVAARERLSGFRAQLAALTGAALEDQFKQLATLHSDCSSASHGGDLGFFVYAKMQAPFSKASFALRVGELSDIVETDSGVHIILRKE